MAISRTSKAAKMTEADKAREKWLAVMAVFNDTYRIVALQDGLATRCQLRECRTANICQADGILACDCRSPTPVEIFDRVVSLLDLRMILKDSQAGRQPETSIDGIRKIFWFIVSEIASRDASFPPDYLAKLTQYANRA